MNWFWTREMSQTNPYVNYIQNYYGNTTHNIGEYWNFNPYKNNWKEQYND